MEEMEQFAKQSSQSEQSTRRDHLISSIYMVLQSFSEERTRTDAWRMSHIAYKGTFNQIVKKLLHGTFLIETNNRKLLITSSGRMLGKFLDTLLSNE